ncbi:SGNH/GDSL hydrolase family protein [Nakamurella alba]|uniref:SGNH/GDSL hydrolase family protein n=1 Tax=Nakamurella alba TaxID=2665158 RepID=UPI002AC32596|nr:SGNH/GDSL hydrolase family protein [Nakamurella alba]
MIVPLLLALSLVTACSSSPDGSGVVVTTSASSTPGSSTTGSGTGTSAATAYRYISIGDSYAAGYQPDGFPTDEGFAQQLVADLAGSGNPLELENFGCPGATSAAVVEDVGCETQDSAPGSIAHPDTTQLAAAEQALRSAPDSVRLVTIIVGGNDIRPCFDDVDPLPCAEDAVATVKKNLTTIVSTVRSIVPYAQIVGLSYPDIYLGLTLTGNADDKARAEASLKVFKDLLNPVLDEVYTASGAFFIDATADSGAYGSMSETTELAGTTLPLPVATVCAYTHFCESQDLHPNSAGYEWYANKILAAVGWTK